MSIIQKYFLFLLFCFFGATTANAQVYPGDVNNDGIVDNTDFLYIGTVFGQVGPPRSIAEQGIAFEEKAIDVLWGADFFNGLDLVYADCDGNGMIDFEDLNAVLTNFGLTHGTLMPEIFPTGNIGVDPPLQFDSSFIFGPFPEFTFVGIPVSLGTPEIPIDEFNGISFEIHYDPTIIFDGSMNFNFSTSWMNTTGNDLHLSLESNIIDAGILRIAATRTSPLLTMNNFGQIGTLQFVIEDNLLDYTQPNLQTMLQFQEITILGPSGNPIPAVNDTITIEITDNGALSNEPTIPDDEINVFPNPFENQLKVKAIHHKIESIKLYNLDGKLVADFTQINKLETELLLDQIPPGVYFVKVQTDEGVLTKKVSKFD